MTRPCRRAPVSELPLGSLSGPLSGLLSINPTPTAARQSALRWLTRREHSRQELRAKLVKRGYADTEIDEVIHALQGQGLLSDARFAESLVRARRARGLGPVRIRYELQKKGVASELIEEKLDLANDAWLEAIRRVRRKKFGARLPQTTAECFRQGHFLHYRGFTSQQIRHALSLSEEMDFN